MVNLPLVRAKRVLSGRDVCVGSSAKWLQIIGAPVKGVETAPGWWGYSCPSGDDPIMTLLKICFIATARAFVKAN